MERKEIGSLLCARREAAGLTRRAFAGRVQVSAARVLLWERGWSVPTPLHFERLCRVLRLRPDEVLYWELKDRAERNADAHPLLRIGLQIVIFIPATVVFYRLLGELANWILLALEADTGIAAWVAWFVLLAAAPALAYLLCGPAANAVLRRIFKE